MDSHTIQQLKKEWTGQSVAIAHASGAFSRFRGRAGNVITVNMNGRALVQFDGDTDICRYDIPLPNLRKVTKSNSLETSKSPPETTPRSATNSSAIPATPPTKPAPTKGLSVLELARRQGAAK